MPDLPSYLYSGTVLPFTRLVKRSTFAVRPLVTATFSVSFALLLTLALTLILAQEGTARSKHRSSAGSHAASSRSASHGSTRSSGASSSSRSRAHHGRGTRTARGSHGQSVAHHGRHHHVVAHHESKSRHAYPIGIFIKSPPPFDSSPLEDDSARDVISAFNHGNADSYPARTLVRAGIVHYHPLHGGIYWRREPVKYIVMHSTETGIPISAVHVIEGWSSMGMRHPGAQYVVDRDGTIYQAVDPDLATVHVNIFKTLPGINNDNSIGIEMNHTGSQNYPVAQREAVIKLVGYLKHRYNIDEGNIITHRYAQQGDHTDPVNFDWDDFLATVNTFHNQAIAYRTGHIKEESRHWQREPEPKANTYLKPHREMGGTAPVEEKSTEMEEPALPAPVPGAKPAVEKDSVMPGESPVPEPSEADTSSKSDATTGATKNNGISGAPGSAPVEMKVYPSAGQAPLPGPAPVPGATEPQSH